MTIFGDILPLSAAELQMFSDVRLISNPANDGDSFFAEAAGQSFHLRLYFADCPETSVSFKSDAERVREQTRYFGLSDATRTVHFGNEAKKFTEHALARPFTVYTAFAGALGRSSGGRVYGFVITADGNDLAGLLVRNGFACTKGKSSRETPDGVTAKEMTARLHDLENSAMLKHAGIWSETDPDRIAELRAKQRIGDNELHEITKNIKKPASPKGSINLNTATEKELKSVRGIGTTLAKKIIAGRPYKTIDDLKKIKGICPKKLENIRSDIVIRSE